MGATPPARAKELSLTVDSGRRVRGYDFAGAGCRFLNMGIVATPVISDHKTIRPGTCVCYCNHEKLNHARGVPRQCFTSGWWFGVDGQQELSEFALGRTFRRHQMVYIASTVPWESGNSVRKVFIYACMNRW